MSRLASLLQQKAPANPTNSKARSLSSRGECPNAVTACASWSLSNAKAPSLRLPCTRVMPCSRVQMRASRSGRGAPAWAWPIAMGTRQMVEALRPCLASCVRNSAMVPVEAGSAATPRSAH
jgi:hypothetical protein